MNKSKKTNKKIAVFDIDGTIFRSSLFIELVEAMISKGVFKRSIRKAYGKQYLAWMDRKGSYEDYINSMVNAFNKNIKGVKLIDFLSISNEVIAAKKDRVYRFTRDLVKELKKKNYFVVAISQSPKIILDPFCKKLGFDKVYGRMYEVSPKGLLTGKVMYLDQISDKSKILQRAVDVENLTLKGSVAVGDTEGDISVLSVVETPICFNPNKTLFDVAKKKKWKVVVERKDVIYKIQ